MADREMQRTIIEPNGHNFQYWKDIWRYRELALNFAKRDVTVRYKQTKIGLGWALISPVINMIIMTFIFGNVAGLSSEPGVPYSVMVYAGIIPWTMLSRSVQGGAGTFISNAGIMKKVYFPRILSPIGSAMTNLIDTLISCGVLVILMVIFHFLQGFVPSIRIVLIPLVLIWALILGTFAGLFLSAFNVKWRDLNHALPFLISLGQYASPVAYSVNANFGDKWWLPIYCINPAVGVLETFKWCVINDMKFNTMAFLISIAWTVAVVPLGVHFFRKTERTFVDIV
ncbi:MAG: ABC transporter permease [Clostridia bacterium]|nr:ABC transporter permease [Clostridia bacterium]